MAPSSGVTAALLSFALFSGAGGHSSVNDAFPSNYYEHHNRTGYTDPCWTPEPFAETDWCHMQGFCTSDHDDEKFTCDCFYGFAGEFCEENILTELCDGYDCGMSAQGMCVLEQATLQPTCICHASWTGSNCREPVNHGESDVQNYCAGVKCNNHGTCVNNSPNEPNFKCDCELGWGGPHCGQETEECTPVYLLDTFARLIPFGGQLAQECGYSKPILFSDANNARSLEDLTFPYYPFCICADLWREHLPEDYTWYTKTCRMDMYRTISFGEESDSYCPACDDSQDQAMEDWMTGVYDTCYHFVYERETMPLYWRSIWKCVCVGDMKHDTARTLLTCPFMTHAAKDDYPSYNNCAEEKICAWEHMYEYFDEVFSHIDLEGSKICKEWLETWIFTIPGEARFEEYEDLVCPCMNALRANCDGCDEILDCIPVTFHQLTIKETYEQVCYNPAIKNRNCLNWINWIAVKFAAEEFMTTTVCYSAMELAISGLPMSRNLKLLMCSCIGRVAEMFYDDPYITYALACIPEEFSLDMAECPGYSGPGLVVPVTMPSTGRRRNILEVQPDRSENNWRRRRGPEASKPDTTPADWAAPDLPDPIRARRRTTEAEEEERVQAWRYATLFQIPVIIGLSGLTWYLRKQKRLTAEELAVAWPTIKG